MFRNYCVIILRNLWRNKLYTSVNIITLAIGIATIVWGFQDYRYSMSFEDFHKDGKNIFRVLTKPAGSDFLQGVCPGTLAMVVKNDFPFVKEAVRWESRSLNVKAAQSEPFESEADFTSSAFFNVFNFPLTKGDPKTALKYPYTAVLTETTA